MGEPAATLMFDREAAADARRVARMNRVDAMAPDLRELMHEFGLSIVDAFLQHGVTRPKSIRHLINAVRNGSVEIGNRDDAPSLMREADRR